MLEQVRKFVDEYGMLEPGDRVIAAVSGGADSVCLLSVLARIAPELPVSLRVVHVHHGLRGAEADRDEAYVRELCGRLQLPFTSVHRNVAAYAAEKGLSTEEAGRKQQKRGTQRWEPDRSPQSRGCRRSRKGARRVSRGRRRRRRLPLPIIRRIRRRPFCITCSGGAGLRGFPVSGRCREERYGLFCVWGAGRSWII